MADWSFNDKVSIQTLIGRRCVIRIGGRSRPMVDLSLGQYLDAYLLSKRMDVVNRFSRRIYKDRKMPMIRLIKKLYVLRKSMRSIQYGFGKMLGFIPKVKELNQLIKKIRDLHPYPFVVDYSSSKWYDKKHEAWIYLTIDKLAADYGWTIKEILSLKYRAVLELMATGNNRYVNKMMDDLSISLSGHVGGSKIMDDMKSRYIKRKVRVPDFIKEQSDKEEMQKLRRALGGR